MKKTKLILFVTIMLVLSFTVVSALTGLTVEALIGRSNIYINDLELDFSANDGYNILESGTPVTLVYDGVVYIPAEITPDFDINFDKTTGDLYLYQKGTKRESEYNDVIVEPKTEVIYNNSSANNFSKDDLAIKVIKAKGKVTDKFYIGTDTYKRLAQVYGSSIKQYVKFGEIYIGQIYNTNKNKAMIEVKGIKNPNSDENDADIIKSISISLFGNDIDNLSYITNRGIKIGSTAGDVIKAYGKTCIATRIYDEKEDMVTLEYAFTAPNKLSGTMEIIVKGPSSSKFEEMKVTKINIKVN